ncbi:MAG TPA: type IV pilus secretin PilQ [Candidatus Binatia bacterium]|nr:type IV pilus secretin PilQ [Candidatus Binatia bacterium]
MNTRRFNPWTALMGAVLLAGSAAAQAPAASAGRSVTGLDVINGENDRLQLVLTLSDAAPEPVVFTVDKPARLALDLPDTKLALTDRVRKLGTGKVRSVALAEAGGRTRVVVELLQLVPYTVRAEGSRVVIELQGAGAAGSTLARNAGPTGASALSAQILGIDFRRGEGGAGRVVVKLGDPRTAVDVREEGGRIVAQFRNTDVPEEQLRRLDVLDFATPVKFVDVVRQGGNVNVVLTPVSGGEFEQVAYQTGDQYTIELQPLSKEKQEEARRKEQVYTGERISLSFQNIDVRSLLQIIGDVSGNNVVISDGVRGDLAMRLQNVPWDQALDIILKTKGLGMQQQGNVMLIAPLDEIAARAKAEGEASKQKDEGAPLRSELIQINYANAGDIAALLKSGDNSLMTLRGKVTVDARTNTLLVLETREKLADIRALITQLDVPVRQVLIESRIVVANDDFSKTLGARFGVANLGFNGAGTRLGTVQGSANATDATFTAYDGGAGTLEYGSLADRLNVNLPAPGAAGRIAFGVLTSNFLVDLELSALQAEGRGEVYSTPRVVTTNSKQASIEQGVEIPYLQASSSGAANVAFKKAVLSLQVTPQITPDDRIKMDLAVQNDSKGQDVNSGTGGTIPSIDARRVNTQVLVRNGETVVLGGVYQQTVSSSVTKVPLLGDLPLLGYLFRTNNNINNKRELLIFITPKILNDSLRVN